MLGTFLLHLYGTLANSNCCCNIIALACQVGEMKSERMSLEEHQWNNTHERKSFICLLSKQGNILRMKNANGTVKFPMPVNGHFNYKCNQLLSAYGVDGSFNRIQSKYILSQHWLPVCKNPVFVSSWAAFAQMES